MRNNHWVSYMNEEYGREVIDCEYGFISYSFNNNECVIHDLFIEKGKRLEGHGIKLCERLFEACRDKGISIVGCFVSLNRDNPSKHTALIASYIKHGFKIINFTNNQIVMIKEL